MTITVLDSASIGSDLDFSLFDALGTVRLFKKTETDEVAVRLADTEIVVLNKIKVGEAQLAQAKRLRLICIAATGYDNIDIAACKRHGVAVCNVAGYSTDSVAQVTVAMVLSLACHITAYTRFVVDGSYTASGVPNALEPVYHELAGKTWGIFGYGAIGRRVGAVAKALGCRILVCKRTPCPDAECVDADTICQKSDIISLHLPLNEMSLHLIDARRLSLMKKDVILVNAARGAVTDEAAVVQAVLHGEIGAFGCDVFSSEPLSSDHPFNKIKELTNVCLTPHMAWGAYEARVRCLSEIKENISAFLRGDVRNRIDLI